MDSTSPAGSAQAKQRRVAFIILAIIVLAGGVLRFYDLGGKALWLDEVFTMVRTDGAGPGEILERVKTNERHPPLFHLLSAPLLRPGHGDAAVRLLPALASSLTVLLTGLLAWRAFGRNAGLVAAGLAAVSSFEVVAGQEGRPTALATMLLAAATLAFHRAVFGEKGRGAALAALAYGLLTALALHTYYYAVFLVAAQLLFLLLRGVVLAVRPAPETGRPQAFIEGLCWPAALAGMVGGLLFLPWLLWARESLARFSGMAAAKETVNYGPLTLLDFFRALTIFPLKFGVGWLNWGLAVLVVLLLAAAIVAGWRRHRPSTALFALLLALPLLAVLLTPFKPELFQARHLAFLGPYFFVLLAALPGLLRPRWLAIIPGLLYLGLNLFSLQLYFDEGTRKTAVREATAAIAAAARPGDAVLFNPAFASHSFERYETGQPLPRIIVHPGEFERLKGELRRRPRVWLVEYRGATFGPLPSYDATVRRTLRPAGKRRTFAGYNEAITVSLHVNPAARPRRPGPGGTP